MANATDYAKVGKKTGGKINKKMQNTKRASDSSLKSKITSAPSVTGGTKRTPTKKATTPGFKGGTKRKDIRVY
jgi:hypothetical protein